MPGCGGGAVLGRRITRLAGRWSRRLLVVVLLVVTTLVVGFAVQARWRLPDLQPWHRTVLDGEFRADAADGLDFAGYRALEERLFAGLGSFLADPANADHHLLGRYTPGSLPNRPALESPYNRSYELVPEQVRGSALLLHGLSDSPYSMRALAELLQQAGFHVVVLRHPGHGTLPSALLDVTWQDWAAATRLAVRHAAAQARPGQPFYLAGYSTGGALALLYALEAADDPALPRPARLVLLSPAIGLTPFAPLTRVVSLLSFLPYFEKAKWLDVLPEYDPYKYNSFPVNAANQIYGLTQRLQAALRSAGERGRLADLPPVLAFQSLVDATVAAADLVDRVFEELPAGGHELVVFDINRHALLQSLIAEGPRKAFDREVEVPALSFDLTVVANRSAESADVAAWQRPAGGTDTTPIELGLRWPRDVVSLSHVALPFPPDDPVYGLAPRESGEVRFTLGETAMRGEAGVTVVPLGSLARLRSNPFFAVVRSKLEAAIAKDTGG